MRPVTAPALLLCGLAALCVAGCYGPMNSPYGYGAPGYATYGTPGTFQTLTPGGTYVPGGTVTPGVGGPSPTYDPSGGAAPNWGGGSNMPVPTPSDPNGSYVPGGDHFYQPRTTPSI
jgi:hypothetical protein